MRWDKPNLNMPTWAEPIWTGDNCSNANYTQNRNTESNATAWNI